MIYFNASKCIQQKFANIDFDVLSSVYSIVYDSSSDKTKKRRHFIINVKLVKGNNSWYAYQTGTTVNLAICEQVDTEIYFHRTLLHEFRHFMQDKIFKIHINSKTYDDSTRTAYRNSPIEVDAVAFEKKNLYKVIRLYNKLVKAKKTLTLPFVQKHLPVDSTDSTGHSA